MSPDISFLSPKLQEQWHDEGNRHLGQMMVKPQSGLKAVWHCNECPAGQPHIWTATVQGRTRGTQCPYCSNKLVCLHNSLATIPPDQTQHWNHSKNEKSPDQLSAGSHFRAEWKCPECKWEWQARISGRVRITAGCPRCKRARPNSTSGSPHLLQLSLPAWLSGTMTAAVKTASIQMLSLWAAASWCTGSAHAVQEGSHTAGEQRQIRA